MVDHLPWKLSLDCSENIYPWMNLFGFPIDIRKHLVICHNSVKNNQEYYSTTDLGNNHSPEFTNRATFRIHTSTKLADVRLYWQQRFNCCAVCPYQCITLSQVFWNCSMVLIETARFLMIFGTQWKEHNENFKNWLEIFCFLLEAFTNS